MPSALTPLATTTLASNLATVSFTNISGAYRDLRLVCSMTSSGAYGGGIVINADTTNANYSWVQVAATASAFSNTGNGISNSLQFAPNWNLSTSEPTTLVTDFLDYQATDKHKNFLLRTNTASAGVTAMAARWANTAAITSLTIQVNTGTFAAGSTFSLYGVTA